jgi:hypothetical protein
MDGAGSRGRDRQCRLAAKMLCRLANLDRAGFATKPKLWVHVLAALCQARSLVLAVGLVVKHLYRTLVLEWEG